MFAVLLRTEHFDLGSDFLGSLLVGRFAAPADLHDDSTLLFNRVSVRLQ